MHPKCLFLLCPQDRKNIKRGCKASLPKIFPVPSSCILLVMVDGLVLGWWSPSPASPHGPGQHQQDWEQDKSPCRDANPGSGTAQRSWCCGSSTTKVWGAMVIPYQVLDTRCVHPQGSQDTNSHKVPVLSWGDHKNSHKLPVATTASADNRVQSPPENWNIFAAVAECQELCWVVSHCEWLHPALIFNLQRINCHLD